MSTKICITFSLSLASFLPLLVGCGSSPAIHAVAAPSKPANAIELSKNVVGAPVSNRPGNLNGVVFVAEYHHFKAGKGEMFRTVKQFRADLDTYYKLGFRPVLASEYLANKMPLPKGASPIILSFDDSTPTQLQLKPDGTVDPDCAIGIWQEFAKTHPDFPVHGTFFILPDQLWSHGRRDPRKARLLLGLGSELANHTMTHPILRKLSDEKVKAEVGTANERLAELGQSLPVSLALPFGVSPKNPSILRAFDWQGKHMESTGVFLNGAEPARSPNDPKFNRYRIPRILATTVPYGMDFWIKRAESGAIKLFVQP